MKLIRLRLCLDKDKIQYNAVEYEIKSEGPLVYVLDAPESGRATRRIPKEDVMKGGVSVYYNEAAAYVWCFDEQFEDAKLMLKDRLEKALDQNVEYKKKELEAAENMGKQLRTCEVTTKRQTYEDLNS